MAMPRSGLWFLRGQVAPLPDGTFSGAHTNGDILVLSDFTNGGGTPTIRVFEWHSPGGSINGTLDLIGGSLTPQDCATVADDDPFCAIVNADTAASPWAFTPKSGAAGSFPPGHFYEGGLDLAFLGLEDECFSSVIFETRSSQSVDAVLKDFIAGGFENCGAHISISPSGVNAVGGPHTFTVTVTQNIGGTETPVAGAHPTVTLTAAGGAAVAAGKVDTCATTGTNAAGQCTVTFTSNTAGTVSGHAAATVTVQGAPFSVETNGSRRQLGRCAEAVRGRVGHDRTVGRQRGRRRAHLHDQRDTARRGRDDRLGHDHAEPQPGAGRSADDLEHLRNADAQQRRLLVHADRQQPNAGDVHRQREHHGQLQQRRRHAEHGLGHPFHLRNERPGRKRPRHEAVRRREDRDHAGDGHERGRHEPRADDHGQRR